MPVVVDKLCSSCRGPRKFEVPCTFHKGVSKIVCIRQSSAHKARGPIYIYTTINNKTKNTYVRKCTVMTVKHEKRHVLPHSGACSTRGTRTSREFLATWHITHKICRPACMICTHMYAAICFRLETWQGPSLPYGYAQHVVSRFVISLSVSYGCCVQNYARG